MELHPELFIISSGTHHRWRHAGKTGRGFNHNFHVKQDGTTTKPSHPKLDIFWTAHFDATYTAATTSLSHPDVLIAPHGHLTHLQTIVGIGPVLNYTKRELSIYAETSLYLSLHGFRQ